MFPSLELLDVRHVDELFRLTDTNRKHLRAWLPWVDSSRSAEDTKAFIRQTQKQLAGDNGFQAFAISERWLVSSAIAA
jgi:ribosomal-protein-serine acetyltransferase